MAIRRQEPRPSEFSSGTFRATLYSLEQAVVHLGRVEWLCQLRDSGRIGFKIRKESPVFYRLGSDLSIESKSPRSYGTTCFSVTLILQDHVFSDKGLIKIETHAIESCVPEYNSVAVCCSHQKPNFLFYFEFKGCNPLLNPSSQLIVNRFTGSVRDKWC